MQWKKVLLVAFCGIVGLTFFLGQTKMVQAAVTATMTLTASGASDQDDMAIWIHPSDTTKSLIISSDKVANKIFVYKLDGTLSQPAISVGEPGNIDIRYGFNLGGQNVDIVAFNERTTRKILVYKINAAGTGIEKVDNGNILNTLSPNYGFGLYKDQSTGKLYAITTQDNGGKIEQFELVASGSQVIKGTTTRAWTVGGQSEGVVVDDATRTIFLAEEGAGVWKLGAGMGDPTPGTKIKTSGGNYNPDMEGITIYHAGNNGAGYVILSSQGSNKFTVFDLQAPHADRGFFTITSTGGTDGIDVTNVNLGTVAGRDFTKGIFTSHNGSRANTQNVVKWSDVAAQFSPALAIDTSWNPRGISNLPIPTSTPGQAATPTATPRPGTPTPTLGPASNTPKGVLYRYGGSLALLDKVTDGVVNWLDALFMFRGGSTGNPTATPTTGSGNPTATPTTGGGGGTIATEANFKVAFVGDSGSSTPFQNVINLMKAEGAQMVIHGGDFAYNSTISGWTSKITAAQSSWNAPYLGSEGNHDTGQWASSNGTNSYANFFKAQAQKYGVTLDDPNLDDSVYTAEYKGLLMVATGQSASDGTLNGGGAANFINAKLANDRHIWKVCSWHHNMTALTPGPKSESYSSGTAYEACRQRGAIVVNGHAHTYGRTRTLMKTNPPVIDTSSDVDCNGVDRVCTRIMSGAGGSDDGGRTIVVDSSNGGDGAREAVCSKVSGSNWWASISATNTNVKNHPGPGFPCGTTGSASTSRDGAMFITFNVDGNPRKARGYYKNTSGQIWDEFTLTAK